jgi:hypothetical protein
MVSSELVPKPSPEVCERNPVRIAHLQAHPLHRVGEGFDSGSPVAEELLHQISGWQVSEAPWALQALRVVSGARFLLREVYAVGTTPGTTGASAIHFSTAFWSFLATALRSSTRGSS